MTSVRTFSVCVWSTASVSFLHVPLLLLTSASHTCTSTHLCQQRGLMLAWVKRDVDSPYGAVSTLHWAVPPTEETDHDTHDQSKNPVEEVSMTTEEQVALESAEDQLGAVLWNSNTAALRHLHQHIFPDHPRLRARFSADTGKAEGQGAVLSSTTSTVLRDIRVVELGAGVGCLGIALAMAGARCAITDLKELLPLMAYNAQLNASRVRRLSHGHGACEALAWKWGPSTATNPKKQLRKYEQEAAGHAQARGADAVDKEVAVATAMVTALAEPTEPWRACSAFLAGGADVAKVDYVIMCDALYGNPQTWPQLLYTLTELMAANPDTCEVVNFCEQRVEDVEGAFLKRLDEENTRILDLWRQSRATTTTRTTSPTSSRKRQRETASPVRALSKTQAHELLNAPALLLERAMLEKQRPLLASPDSTPYVWQYKREKVAEAVSELQMPILVTRIRWVRAEADHAPSSKKTKSE